MRVTKRQLRRIIRESLNEAGRGPAEASAVLSGLQVPMAGPGAPDPFSSSVMSALEVDDIQTAARSLQDSMWIDDSWPEDDEALEDMLTDANPQTIEDVAAVGAEWLTQFRAGGWHEGGWPEAGLESLYTRPRK